jgi:hypothetical protein
LEQPSRTERHVAAGDVSFHGAVFTDLDHCCRYSVRPASTIQSLYMIVSDFTMA